MHWGEYTIRIEQIGTGVDLAEPRLQKLTVLSASGLAVYTVTDEGIGQVKLEPILGGQQPELLIQTSEGGDGTARMDMALTQQGGVHDIFCVNDEYSVRAVRMDSSTSEEIVVDTPLDVSVAELHHFPVLTSTFRWNGQEFENATSFLPSSTEARITQYEQDLASSTSQEDQEKNTVGLLANVNLLGKTSLPASVVRSSGFRSGYFLLQRNQQDEQIVVQAVANAKKSLPKSQATPLE